MRFFVGVAFFGTTYPGLLEEGFARSFAGGISSLSQALHVDESDTGEHDCVVQQQAGLAIEAIAVVNNRQERVNVHQWHIRMDKLNVSLQQCILQSHRWKRQRTLCLQVAHVVRGNLGRKGADKRRQLSGGIVIVERVEELDGARVTKQAGGINGRVDPRDASVSGV